MKVPVLFYIFLLIQSGTAIVGGFRYRNLPRPLRILEWLIIISTVVVVGQLTLAFIKIHNLWMSHFYTLIEIVFVVFMYSSWMKKPQNRFMLSLCLLAFVLFWIVSKFTFESFAFRDGWTATISMILQIIFSIATGIIIYAAGSLFWFAFFNKMLQISPERFKQVYNLNWILSILSNLLYARGFLCKR